MNNIKKLIKEKGLRREEVAYKAGVSMTGLSNIITGKGNPKLSTIKGLMTALDCDFKDIWE